MTNFFQLTNGALINLNRVDYIENLNRVDYIERINKEYARVYFSNDITDNVEISYEDFCKICQHIGVSK